MQEDALLELAEKIQKLKSESQTIELKAAHQGTPKKLFDTLSSFSNQDSGGIIIFGIDESNNYDIVGVYDPQDLQKKVTEQCNQMEPAVRALFTVCDINGRIIVSAEIPGIDISERPCFYKGVGRIKGSYVRVGDSDEPYQMQNFLCLIQTDLNNIKRLSKKNGVILRQVLQKKKSFSLWGLWITVYLPLRV